MLINHFVGIVIFMVLIQASLTHQYIGLLPIRAINTNPGCYRLAACLFTMAAVTVSRLVLLNQARIGHSGLRLADGFQG
jgi:hypothetical protein